MATMNPYAPPRAEVADVDDDGEAGVQPVRTWSSEGRVGRLRYLAHSTGAYLVLMLAAFLGGVVSGAARMPALINIVIGVAGLAYFIFVVLKSIQRAHDMDWSGWSVLLTLIPFVGFLWIFKGGTGGRNRFGAPPPPNTFGVKFLGLMLPVIGIVGIVAAIALPAYQDYTKRAKMRQFQLQQQQQPQR
jgi:uncharacterized membrane protein YhaH (DUF805 family)